MNAPIIDILKQKHTHLINWYRSVSWPWKDSCYLVALDIAKVLSDCWYLPQIGCIDITHFDEWLMPTVFNWSIKRARHYICMYQHEIYEPLLDGRIIQESQYTKELFGDEKPLSITHDAFETQELIKNPPPFVEDFPNYWVL